VLRLADGRAVFVKAVSAARNPYSPDMHRREARILGALPAGVPAPRLLWSYDDGEWVALMTEAVAGRPPAQPWTGGDLAAFLAVAATLAERLTPSPIAVELIEEHYGEVLTGWRRLASGPAGGLDPWVRGHVDRLAELESAWPAAAAGRSLLHGDLRADNVLLTSSGGVVVDWPSACIGAAWVDLLLALPSVAMHGGGDPEVLWAAYPPARGVDADAATVVLAAGAGYFVYSSLQPPPPNLARVREFQRAQGIAALAWLRRRLRW
jgi:aminoglycoside phosphotransferase (APT) family kinase protein